MNKEQYTNWIKNTAEIPSDLSVTSEIQQYPYCVLFHLIRSMKTDTKEDKALLSILHPCRRLLKARLLYKNVLNENNANGKNDNEKKINIIK